MRTSGVDPYLEEEADLILAEDRRKNKGSKADYLTPGQLERRRFREIYNKNGVPESHLYQGIFRRAYNPLMNKKRGATSSDE